MSKGMSLISEISKYFKENDVTSTNLSCYYFRNVFPCEMI